VEAAAEAVSASTAALPPFVITGSGLTIGDVAYWADSLMVAFLISYAVGGCGACVFSHNLQYGPTRSQIHSTIARCRVTLFYRRDKVATVGTCKLLGSLANFMQGI
jgi:hypothetical protein